MDRAEEERYLYFFPPGRRSYHFSFELTDSSLLSAFDFLFALALRQWNISPWLVFALAKHNASPAGETHFLFSAFCPATEI